MGHDVPVADVEFRSGATLIALSHEATDSVLVTITESDLNASRVVHGAYSGGFESLAAFFAGLARGWEGERVYESLEHDLRFVAKHDGHVRLKVRLWQSSDPNGWVVETRTGSRRRGPDEVRWRVTGSEVSTSHAALRARLPSQSRDVVCHPDAHLGTRCGHGYPCD